MRFYIEISEEKIIEDLKEATQEERFEFYKTIFSNIDLIYPENQEELIRILKKTIISFVLLDPSYLFKYDEIIKAFDFSHDNHGIEMAMNYYINLAKKLKKLLPQKKD